MLSSSKAYLCEDFMTWSEMPNLDSIPLWFKEVQAENDPSLKWQRLQLHLGNFVDEFVLTEFDVETAVNPRAAPERTKQTIQQKSSESDDYVTSHNADQATITKDARTPGMFNRYCIFSNL